MPRPLLQPDSAAAQAEALPALVAQAQRGDQEAVRRLWRTCRSAASAAILAHKPREAELEDLLQEAALAFVRGLPTLRDPAQAVAWTRTIARNVALRAGRDASRARLRLAPAPVETLLRERAIEDAGEEAQQREQVDKAMEALASLPPTYAEPLALRIAHNLSVAQIARTLGLSRAAVETRLARARAMLRQALLHEEKQRSTG